MFGKGRQKNDVEHRLQDLDSKMAAIGRSQALIEFDLDGRILNANDNLLKTMGYEDIQRIDQFDYPKAKAVINAAIKRPGISIVITSRPCALKFKIKEPHFYVDPNICIGCKTCIKTNCPPLRMKKYEGIEKLKSSIDKNQCVGCSICAQVCPVNAIKRSEVEQGRSHEK